MHLPNKQKNSGAQILPEMIFAGPGLGGDKREMNMKVVENYRQAVLQDARENEVLRKTIIDLVTDAHENGSF